MSWSLKTRAADGPDKGIIPQTCSELFARVAEKCAADEHLKFTVEVSYIEVCCNGWILSYVSTMSFSCRYTMRRCTTCSIRRILAISVCVNTRFWVPMWRICRSSRSITTRKWWRSWMRVTRRAQLPQRIWMRRQWPVDFVAQCPFIVLLS